MGNRYYLNKSNASSTFGEHEVHTYTCAFLPSDANKVSLGIFDSCKEALAAAKKLYPSWSIDGCKHCSPGCHKH